MPINDGFDLILSCWRIVFSWIEIVVFVCVKHWTKKRDSRFGSWKMSEGNVDVFLQVGFGCVPKSSLVTW